jgi:hypothetical protein
MRLKNWGLLWSLIAALCTMTDAGLAQDTAAAAAATTSTATPAVPGFINYSGALKDINGKPLTGITGVTFQLYKAEQGGSPIWIETQNITPDKNGKYTVTLGSTKLDASLSDSFANGEARWLGVQVSGQEEQPRVLLVSVPYAMKAGDAQTIAGLPASAFVLANGAKQGAAGTAAAGTASSSTSSKTSAPPTNPTVTGKGVVSFIPMWDTTSDIIDSAIFQKSSQIGIATTSPTATLDVNGKGNVRDTLTLFPKSTDNTLAVSGTAFKISTNGTVTFISGQKFPGTGTITGVTTSGASGLQGGGTTGTLNVSVKPAGVTNAMLQNSKITLNANSAGGLTTPGAMTLGSTFTIGLKPCSASQVLQYNGTNWNCAAAGTGTVTGVTAGSGLSGGGTSGNVTLNVKTAGVTNAMLQNSTFTVNAGSDLTGGGSVPLGGSTTLNLDTTKVPRLAAANTFTGNQAVVGNLSATAEVAAGNVPTGNVASGTVEVDASAINKGGYSPGLNFGGGGEVIISNRAGSTNQYGLDVFTNYTPRLSVTNTGLVGIGVQSPGWMLEVDPPNDSRIFGSGIFGANDTGSGVGASYALYAAGGYDITNISFNSGGLGGFLVGGSSNVGFGGDGVDAWAGSGALANGFAGSFSGDVTVSGNLSKSGGSFKIDHPLDPANKYLYHSFVESPDMMNIYNGNVVLDATGEATVQLPEWFGALNRDYRYQLTSIGGFAPVYIAAEVNNNQFKIAGGKSGMKVSWQVTGIRQDAWANAHRIPVEEQKAERERGSYIHPELHGAPEERGIEWVRHTDIMQKMKARQAKLASAKK